MLFNSLHKSVKRMTTRIINLSLASIIGLSSLAAATPLLFPASAYAVDPPVPAPTLEVYQTTLGGPSGDPQGNIYISGSDAPFLAARDAAIAGTLASRTTYTPAESSIWGAGGAFGSELYMFSVVKNIPVGSLLGITKSGDYIDISTPSWTPGFTSYTTYYPMTAYTHTTSTTAFGYFTKFDCSDTFCTFVTAASLAEDYSGSSPNGSANTPPTDISQTIGFQFRHKIHAEVITGGSLTGVSTHTRGYQQGTGVSGGTTTDLGDRENISSVPSPTTVYVNPAYTTASCGEHECYYDAFPTIQAAINAVASNGTINVADGPYDLTSRIDVNKAVSIIGDVTTPSNVVINAPTGGTLQGQNSVFVITSNDVAIRGFRIQGALHGTGTVQNAGIYVSDPNSLSPPGLSSITISNNELTNNGYGIFVHNIKNSTISNNKVYGSKKVAGKESESGVGIVVFGRTEDANHTHTLAIDHNQVYYNETEGIRVDVESAVGATTFVNDLAIGITNNTVYNNGSPIGGVDKYVGIKSAGWSKGVTVSGNEIYGHTGTTVSPTSGNAGIWIAASNGWVVNNNNIHDNLNGIFFAHSTVDSRSGGHTISNNNIHANVRGISIDDGAEAIANNKNSIYSNNSTTFSEIDFAPYGVFNRGTSTFDATNNWWGDATGPLNATTNPSTAGDSVSDNVNYSPWYSDALMTLPVTSWDLGGPTPNITLGTVPPVTIATGSGTVTVDIPAGLIITGPAGWYGTITLPVVTSTFTLTPDTGNTATALSAISIGYGDLHLTFNQPVKLTFAGLAGKLVGWSQAGVFHQITATCTSATDPALDAGADCKIDVGGADLVVWTKHFTDFVAYTQTATPAPAVAATSPRASSVATRSTLSTLYTDGSTQGDISSDQGVIEPVATTDVPAAAATTDVPATVAKAIQSNHKLLGIAWYLWLTGLAVLVGAGYFVYSRSSDDN